MKSSKRDCGPEYVGSTVVGERGQVVVPKEVRDSLGLKTGAKLLVIQHANGAVILVPAERMRSFIKKLTKNLETFSK